MKGLPVVGLVTVLSILGPTGCARRSDLTEAAKRGAPLALPPADKAVVVFLRPEFLGYAISAAVYEDDHFLGVVMRHARLVRETLPGPHRYMVISEAADFLDADLEAGRIYFVMVRPRTGTLRARFTLEPLTPTSPRWRNVKKWVDHSYPVAPNGLGEYWAQENAPSVEEKKAKYLPRWLAKDESERPALRPGDGVLQL